MLFVRETLTKAAIKKTLPTFPKQGEGNGTPITYVIDNQLIYHDEKLPDIKDSLNRLISRLF